MKSHGALMTITFIVAAHVACEASQQDPDATGDADVPDARDDAGGSDVPDAPGLSVEEACDADCAQLALCFGDDHDGCLDACISWLEHDVTPLCRDMTIALLTCTSTLTCEQLEAYWDAGGSHLCAAEDLEVRRTCY